MNRIDFVNKLNSIVDYHEFDKIEVPQGDHSSSMNAYAGIVGQRNFEIKQRASMLNPKFDTARAKGTYIQKEDLLEIKTEVNGFQGALKAIVIIIAVFYLFALPAIIISEYQRPGEMFNLLLLLHTIVFVIYTFFYVAMRRSTKLLRNQLEIEFYKLTKK